MWTSILYVDGALHGFCTKFLWHPLLGYGAYSLFIAWSMVISSKAIFGKAIYSKAIYGKAISSKAIYGKAISGKAIYGK